MKNQQCVICGCVIAEDPGYTYCHSCFDKAHSVQDTPQPIMPEPESPLHILNLDTIEKLESQGWQGPDESLTISLFEYGFAWRKLDAPDSDGDDVYFIYGIGEICKFDRCGMKSTTDPEKEWDWAFKGMGLADMGELEEWREQTFERKVYELYNKYGHENIFGTPYGGGFTIADPDAE